MISTLSKPVENLGKVWENSRAGKRSPRFSPGYEGTENMFYFLFFYVVDYKRFDECNEDYESKDDVVGDHSG